MEKTISYLINDISDPNKSDILIMDAAYRNRLKADYLNNLSAKAMENFRMLSSKDASHFFDANINIIEPSINITPSSDYKFINIYISIYLNDLPIGLFTQISPFGTRKVYKINGF